VTWLRTASAEIKRDMEIARDEVRVMTVHGAKGLEAPIVILADTTTRRRVRPASAALAGAAVESGAGYAGPTVWAPLKREDTTPVTAARATATADAIDEYRRLLYVAMTRAADRLVICGSVGMNRRPPGCWYDLIADALKPHCSEEPADIGDGTVLRYRKAPAQPEALSLFASTPAPPAPAERPDWLTRDAPGAVAPAPLSPSQLHDETAPTPRAGGAQRQQALARGVIARLLQSAGDRAGTPRRGRAAIPGKQEPRPDRRRQRRPRPQGAGADR
jgi:ATP-dependent helicase/nuclease subunit A